jgi:hypothetical protein
MLGHHDLGNTGVGAIAGVTANETYPSIREPGKQSVLPPAQQLQVASTAIGAVAASKAAAKAIGKLAPGEASNVIAGFGDSGKLAGPYVDLVTPRLVAMAEAKKNAIPANASATDLYRAAYGPHHEASWSSLLDPAVWAKDIALTPLYTAQGGFALGAATAEAAKGNTEPLKEAGRQFVKPVTSRAAAKEFITTHPFQALTAGAGILKGAGALEGRVRGLTPETRSVPLPALGETESGVPTLNRGSLSANANTRRLQNLRDTTTSSSRKLSELAQQREARRIQHAESQAARREANDIVRPVVEARRGVSKKEQESLLYNQGVGARTPEESARFYAGQEGDAAAAHAGTAGGSGAHGSARRRARRVRRSSTRLARLRGSGRSCSSRRVSSSRTRRGVASSTRRSSVSLTEGDPTAETFLGLEMGQRGIEAGLRSAPATAQKARNLEQRAAAEQSKLEAVRAERLREVERRLKAARKVQTQAPGKRPRQGDTPGRIRKLEAERRRLMDAPLTSAPLTSLERRSAALPSHGMLSGQLEQVRADLQQTLDEIAPTTRRVERRSRSGSRSPARARSRAGWPVATGRGRRRSPPSSASTWRTRTSRTPARRTSRATTPRTLTSSSANSPPRRTPSRRVATPSP